MVRGVGGPHANRSRANRRRDAWVGERRAIDVRLPRLFEAEAGRGGAMPLSPRPGARGWGRERGGERPAGGCMTGARAGPPWRRVSGSKHSFLARKSVNGRFAQAGGQDDERIRRR